MQVIQILTHSLSPLSVGDSLFYESAWHSRVAREILKRSQEFDIQCWGVAKGAQEIATREIDGITHKTFPSFSPYPGREWSPQLLRELKAQVTGKPTIVHLHGIFSLITYSVSLFLGKVPLVAQDHFEGSFWLALKPALRYKSIKSIVGNLALSLIEFLPERVALRNIDCFFVLNRRSQRYVAGLVGGGGRVRRQTMGVNFDAFQPGDKLQARATLGLDPAKKYILYVGALTRLKGIYYLLRCLPQVLALYPQSTLLIAGEGYYRQELERLRLKLGIGDRVVFLDYVANWQMPLYYNAADVSVLPSLQEGLGLVGVESLACGTPFVGTRVGGIPDIIENFSAGWLVSPRDSAALAQAITQALSHPHSFNIDREKGRRCYSWEYIIPSTIAVYQDLAARYYGKG